LKFAEEHLTFFRNSNIKRATAILLLAIADVHWAMERPKEALKNLAASIEIFRELKDEDYVAVALQVTAAVNLKLDTIVGTNRALEAAEKALVINRELEMGKQEAETLLLLSKAHLAKQDFEDAYAFVQGASTLSNQMKFEKGRAVALKDLTLVMLAAKEDPDTAITSAKDAVEICQKIQDKPGEIEARKVVAHAYQADGMLNAALENLEAVLELARELKDKKRIKEALEAIAKIHVDEDALQLLEDERVLARDAGDSIRELNAIEKITETKLSMEMMAEALQTAEEAAELSRSTQNKKKEALFLELQARVYDAMKDMDKALATAKKSRLLYEEIGSVREAARVIQMTVYFHEDSGNMKEAVRQYMFQRTTYKAAGWKDEEAATLLVVADMLLQTQGLSEAVRACKEAVALYKETGDKAGEAQAMLNLATIHVSSETGPTAEALPAATSARRLFKALGDASGEAMALQASADVYVAHSAFKDALRVTKEALTLCEKAGDRKGEANALRAVASVHMQVLQREADKGVMPAPEVIDEVLAVTTESAALYQELSDNAGQASAALQQYKAGQASAMLQLSGIHVINDDGDNALKAAKEALELSSKLENGQTEGYALLQVAEAHRLLEDGPAAKQAAEDAKALFQELNDKNGMEIATHLISVAHQKPPKLKRPTAGAIVDGEVDDGDDPKGKGKGKKKAENRLATRAPKLLAKKSQDSKALLAQPKRQGQYSMIVESVEAELAEIKQAEEKMQRREALLARKQEKYVAPDQDARRAHLQMNAWTSSSSVNPGYGEDEGFDEEDVDAPRPSRPARQSSGKMASTRNTLSPSSLVEVLMAVRPDWKDKDLRAVQEKLSKISIETGDELFDLLKTGGTQLLNAKLKEAGLKSLKADTLNALHQEATRRQR